MNIDIINSSIRFKSPQIGQPTRAVESHYNGRRITALVDGEEEMFRFDKEELAFDVTEKKIEQAIEDKLENA